VTISQSDEKMDIPVDEFDGKVIYGEKRKQEGLNRFILNEICKFVVVCSTSI
jgi:hypothetical protein